MLGGHGIKRAASTHYRVLLAEGDNDIRRLLAQNLRESGYDVVACSDGVTMLTHLAGFLLPEELGPEQVDLIISDTHLPGVSGLEVLEGRPKQRDFPPMILIFSHRDEKARLLAAELGAAAVFDKSFGMDDLLGKVKSILCH